MSRSAGPTCGPNGSPESPRVLTERRRGPDPQTPPVESIWAEPGRASDGGASVYVPPTPVREFLEAPTAERARAYLAWNQQRLDAIARATEVLKAVAASQPQRSAASPGTTPAPATCVAPAESGPLREPRFPEPGPRAAGPPPPIGGSRAGASPSCTPSRAGVPTRRARRRSSRRGPGAGRTCPSSASSSIPRPARTVSSTRFRSPSRPGAPALRDQLGVRGYPTILFLRDGVPVEAVSGVTPADRLEAMARGLGA